MDARTKLAKLREWNALQASAWDSLTQAEKDRHTALDNELFRAGVHAGTYRMTTREGRALLAALEAEAAGGEGEDEKPSAILVQRAPDMHAILSDAIALLEMTDEGRTPGTDSYTVCVLGNEVLEGLPYASTVGRPAPQPNVPPILRDMIAAARIANLVGVMHAHEAHLWLKRAYQEADEFLLAARREGGAA